MKKLILILVVVAMVLPGCQKINDALDDLSNRIDKLEQEALPSIEEQIESINTQIASLKAIDSDIKAQIAELEKSDKTTATEIANLKSKDSALEKSISDLQKYVDTQIAKAKSEAAVAYATIEQYNNIVSQLSALQSSTNELGENLTAKINAEVKKLNDKITDLENRLKAVEEKVENLLARIQSVSYIPEYADGKVLIERMGSTSWGTLSFRISPKDAVAELAKVWESAVSCEAYYLKTRAVSLVKLAVTEFVGDEENGIVTVKVSGEGLSDEFFAGTQNAKIALVISDGNNQVVSDYADAYGHEVEIEVDSYKRDWAEQPDYKEGTSLIHKTYYTTLKEGLKVRNFSVCYDTDKICARWVAYPSHTIYTSGKDYQVGGTTAGRTNAWAFDDAVTQYKYSSNWSSAYEIISTYVPALDTYDTYTEPIISQSKQADICNGIGGGYVRGHMLPSADRYSTWNTNAQTYYSTNIMAQDYDFNSASWADLENKVRANLCADTLYVVVGTLFEESKTIEKNGRIISVPSHCYKMLLRTKRGNTNKPLVDIKSADELMCIGFIFENSATGANTDLTDAAVSVADIERRSGFSFYRNLDPSIAEIVKQQNSPSDWGL